MKDIVSNYLYSQNMIPCSFSNQCNMGQATCIMNSGFSYKKNESRISLSAWNKIRDTEFIQQHRCCRWSGLLQLVINILAEVPEQKEQFDFKPELIVILIICKVPLWLNWLLQLGQFCRASQYTTFLIIPSGERTQGLSGLPTLDQPTQSWPWENTGSVRLSPTPLSPGPD